MTDLNVEKLSFPLKVVISLLGGAVALCLFILNVTWEVRSELRDINTRQAAQEELWAERIGNIKDSLGGIRRMQDLQNYEIQALKLSLSEEGIKIRYPDKRQGD
jgi:hypothetical protein